MQRQAYPGLTEHNFSQATILVVEDNDDVWLIVNRVLHKQLPEVKAERVAEAHQAVAYLTQATTEQRWLPKLILHDLYLPRLADGLASLEGIRRHLASYDCQQLPILVMSSSTQSDDIRKAYSKGASSFFRKPTTLGEWERYFQQVRTFWWETVLLPLS